MTPALSNFYECQYTIRIAGPYDWAVAQRVNDILDETLIRLTAPEAVEDYHSEAHEVTAETFIAWFLPVVPEF
jgi:hypothetical protein